MTAKKTALLIIDMQKDVVKKLVKTGASIVPAIKDVLESCRKMEVPVIYLLREHRQNSIDVERFRLALFKEKPFLVENSEGAEVLEELTPLPSEIVISKRRFSGFFQTDLLMILMRLHITSVVVCGLQTPNCIRATVTDALAYDYDVTVLEDATAAQSSEVHQSNLFDMRNMGANIQKADVFLEEMGARAISR